MGKKWLGLGDHDLIFKVTSLYLTSFSSSLHYKDCKNEPCVHPISGLNRWNLFKLAQILHWDAGKKWLDFVTWTSFSRSHWHFETKLLIEKSLCAHYLLNQWLEFDQTSTDTPTGWHLKTKILIEKSLCAHYLLNQRLEFDQTSTDTSIGGGKEVIWFYWLLPHFKVTTISLQWHGHDCWLGRHTIKKWFSLYYLVELQILHIKSPIWRICCLSFVFFTGLYWVGFEGSLGSFLNRCVAQHFETHSIYIPGLWQLRPRDSVWRRPSAIVRQNFQMSETFLTWLDTLSDCHFLAL